MEEFMAFSRISDVDDLADEWDEWDISYGCSCGQIVTELSWDDEVGLI